MCLSSLALVLLLLNASSASPVANHDDYDSELSNEVTEMKATKCRVKYAQPQRLIGVVYARHQANLHFIFTSCKSFCHAAQMPSDQTNSRDCNFRQSSRNFRLDGGKQARISIIPTASPANTDGLLTLSSMHYRLVHNLLATLYHILVFVTNL